MNGGLHILSGVLILSSDKRLFGSPVFAAVSMVFIEKILSSGWLFDN